MKKIILSVVFVLASFAMVNANNLLNSVVIEQQESVVVEDDT